MLPEPLHIGEPACVEDGFAHSVIEFPEDSNKSSYLVFYAIGSLWGILSNSLKEKSSTLAHALTIAVSDTPNRAHKLMKTSLSKQPNHPIRA